MRNIILVLVPVLIFVVVAAYFLLNQPPAVQETVITGIVTDSNSSLPISNALITVGGNSLQTASNGSFHVTVNYGSYSISVNKYHYTNKTVAVTVNNASVTLRIALTPLVTPQNKITLRILTRHDSTIQTLCSNLFLQSQVAKDYNIVELRFIPVAAALWDSYLQRNVIDVAWGGGPTIFDQYANYWAPLNGSIVSTMLNKIPDDINGVPMKRFDASQNTIWVAAAISSFGFTVNNAKLTQWGISKPSKWIDLASPNLAKIPSPQVGEADPTKSTSNTRIYHIILQAYGWDAGWRNLTLIAANSKIYDTSDAIREDVISGGISIGITIDFYGYTAMMNNPDTEYIVPSGESILNGDPISLTNGAVNVDASKAFIAWILSEEGQKIWLDPNINRMPVNPDVFNTPEGQARSDLEAMYNITMTNFGIDFNETLASIVELPMQYYFKAILVDANIELKQAWSAVVALENTNSTRYEQLRKELTDPIVFKDPDTNLDTIFTVEYAASIATKLAGPEYLNNIMEIWRQAAVKQYNDVTTLATGT
jgi:ABC-type Fe3+ transport system substrate-binding protein